MTIPAWLQADRTPTKVIWFGLTLTSLISKELETIRDGLGTKKKKTPITYGSCYRNLDAPKNGEHAPLQQNLKSLETPQQNFCIEKKFA